MRNYLIFTMLALALLASCSRSSIQRGALTRVIVERKSLPTDDTILARLGGADATAAQQGSEQGSGQDGSATGSESDPTVTAGSEKPSAPTKGTGSTEGSQAEPATEPAPVLQELIYHVIVASLPLERADVVESEVAKLRAAGVDAHIVKSDGRARLAYASFATKAEATAARDSLVRTTPKYRDAWVLRAKL